MLTNASAANSKVNFTSLVGNIRAIGYQFVEVAFNPLYKPSLDPVMSFAAPSLDPFWSVTDPTTLAGYSSLFTIAGSTITITNNATLQQLYDYCRYYLVQNRGVTPFFSTIDGVHFTSTYSIVNNAVMSGTGYISTSGTWTGSGSTTLIITTSGGTSGLLTLTVPDGSSLAIWNQAGARMQYIAASGTEVTQIIPAGVTGSYTYKVTKYGYTAASGFVTVTGGGYLNASPSLIPDAFVSDSVSNVAAYTTLENCQKVYDYAAYFETTTAGIDYARIASKNGSALDFGSAVITLNSSAGSAWAWASPNLTIKCADFSTSGIFTEFNAMAAAVTWGSTTHTLVYTDALGRHVRVTVPAIISGSRVQLWNLTDSVELDNSVCGSGGYIFNTTYSDDKLVRVRASYCSGTTAKDEFLAVGTLSSNGLSVSGSQTDCAVYNLNAVDGSTVTEFSSDYTHILIDISDPDGTTTLSRLYAWYHYILTTDNGIRNFFGAMSAADTSNYLIDQTVTDLHLDNISALPVRVIGGYLSRKDGSTVIASTSGSIQMDPSKAYIVNGLTISDIESLNLATEATAQKAADNAELSFLL